MPFAEINARHLKQIAEVLQAQPVAVRHTERDFIQLLAAGRIRLFEFDEGIVCCHQDSGRLVIDATSCGKLGLAWKLLPDLKRLAADWLCDTIQTTVFKKQLADAIVKLGGRIESYDLVLDVEATDNEQ